MSNGYSMNLPAMPAAWGKSQQGQMESNGRGKTHRSKDYILDSLHALVPGQRGELDGHVIVDRYSMLCSRHQGRERRAKRGSGLEHGDRERERGGNERYRRSIVWCLEREREKVVCEPDAGLGGRVTGDLCAVRGRHCSPMSQGVVSPWRRGRARWDRVRSGEP